MHLFSSTNILIHPWHTFQIHTLCSYWMADKEEEFEIVNEEDAVVGRAPRSRAHAEGLLHRAVYCWVFDTAGNVLIQKRSAEKKIGPSQWDLSVAEHLQPGETYREVRAVGGEACSRACISRFAACGVHVHSCVLVCCRVAAYGCTNSFASGW